MQGTLFHVLHSVNSFSANRQYIEKFHTVYPNLAELIGNYTHIPRHKLPIARLYATALIIRAESVGVVSDDPFPMSRASNRLLSEGFWSQIRIEEISKYAFSYVVIWLGKISAYCVRCCFLAIETKCPGTPDPAPCRKFRVGGHVLWH